jgi:hypothetical protein
MLGATSMILPPKEYRREMDKMPELFPGVFEGCTDRLERERKARNCLTSMKVYERADYGLLMDLRERVALRLAPWLRTGKR